MLVERVSTFSLLFDNCSVTNIFLDVLRCSLFSYTHREKEGTARKLFEGWFLPFTKMRATIIILIHRTRLIIFLHTQ